MTTGNSSKLWHGINHVGTLAGRDVYPKFSVSQNPQRQQREQLTRHVCLQKLYFVRTPHWSRLSYAEEVQRKVEKLVLWKTPSFQELFLNWKVGECVKSVDIVWDHRRRWFSSLLNRIRYTPFGNKKFQMLRWLRGSVHGFWIDEISIWSNKIWKYLRLRKNKKWRRLDQSNWDWGQGFSKAEEFTPLVFLDQSQWEWSDLGFSLSYYCK